MGLRNDLFDDLEEVQRPSPNIELLDKLKLYLDRTEVKVALAILIIVLIVGYLRALVQECKAMLQKSRQRL